MKKNKTLQSNIGKYLNNMQTKEECDKKQRDAKKTKKEGEHKK